MKKVTLTKLISKKFPLSYTYANRRIRGIQMSSTGVSVKHINDAKVVELKRKNYNKYTKQMEVVRSVEYIPTGEVEIEWVNRTIGKSEDISNKINEISKFLKEQCVKHYIKGDKIITNIEVEMPKKIARIIN